MFVKAAQLSILILIKMYSVSTISCETTFNLFFSIIIKYYNW